MSGTNNLLDDNLTFTDDQDLSYPASLKPLSQSRYQPKVPEDEKRWSKSKSASTSESLIDWSDPTVKKKAIKVAIYSSVAIVIILVIVLVVVFVAHKKHPSDITKLSLYDGPSKVPAVVTHPKDQVTVLMATRNNQFESLKDYSWSLSIGGKDTALINPAQLTNGISFTLPQAFTTTAKITVKDLVHKNNSKTLTFTILPNFHFLSGPGSAPPDTLPTYKLNSTNLVQLHFNDPLIPSNTTWTLQTSYDQKTWSTVPTNHYTFSYDSQLLTWTLESSYTVNIVYWRLMGNDKSFPQPLIAQAPFPLQVAGAPAVFTLISIDVETSSDQVSSTFQKGDPIALVIMYAGTSWPSDTVPVFTYTDGTTPNQVLTNVVPPSSASPPPPAGTIIYTSAIPSTIITTNSFAVTITKGNQSQTSPKKTVNPVNVFTLGSLTIPSEVAQYTIGSTITLNLAWSGASSFPATTPISVWNYSTDGGTTWSAIAANSAPQKTLSSNLVTLGSQNSGVQSYTYVIPGPVAASYQLQAVGITTAGTATLQNAFATVNALTFTITSISLDKTYYLPTDTVTATVAFTETWPSSSSGVTWNYICTGGTATAFTVTDQNAGQSSSPKTFTFLGNAINCSSGVGFQLQITSSAPTYTSAFNPPKQISNLSLSNINVSESSTSFSPGNTVTLLVGYSSTDPNGWNDFNGKALTTFSYQLNGVTTAITPAFVSVNTGNEQASYTWQIPTSLALGSVIIIQAQYNNNTAVQTAKTTVVVSFATTYALNPLNAPYKFNLLVATSDVLQFAGPATCHITTITGLSVTDITSSSFVWSLGYLDSNGSPQPATLIFQPAANPDPKVPNTMIFMWYVSLPPSSTAPTTPQTYTPYISYIYNGLPAVYIKYAAATFTPRVAADMYSTIPLTSVSAVGQSTDFKFGQAQLGAIYTSTPTNSATVPPITNLYWCPIELNVGEWYQGDPKEGTTLVGAVGIINSSEQLITDGAPQAWEMVSNNQGQTSVFMRLNNTKQYISSAGTDGSYWVFLPVGQTSTVPLYSTANTYYFGP